MSTKHLLDSELHPIIELVPGFNFSADSVAAVREQLSALNQMGDAQSRGVAREEVLVSRDRGPDVRALLYTKQSGEGLRPGYVHVHGGGYVLGSADGSDINNIEVAAKLGAVVLSVDYRLAPEHPIPAPLEDCYAGLAWLHENARALNVDTSRIAVGGESAGGGLAAALAIHARDKGEYAVCHQHLTYPMLDNRTGTAEQPGDPLTGEFVWTREANQFGWTSYLGDAPALAPQVPSRVEDFAGLPPAWIFTVGLDLFRDENIAYAQGLMAAGVPTELIVYPGACHGFQMIPGTKSLAFYSESHLGALGRALGVELS